MLKSKARVRGFLYTQILEKDPKTGKVKIVGDSGWKQNTVTNFGLDNAMAGACIGQAASVQVGYAGLASQSTTVNVTQASLLGASDPVNAVDVTTIVTGKGRCTVSFHGSDMGGTMTIGSIGLFSTDTQTAAADMIAGATFATSQYASDQSVNATYQLEFS